MASADLLIISHSAFSDHLGDLVAAREAQGLDVKIVEVEDVYAAYSGEVFDPAAISAYIADAAVAFDDPAVLLVGADSYDYRDDGGTGSMSFIPTIYGDVGIGGIAWSPIDPAFVDLDHDRVPDLALGRFPVRDLDELSNAIDKAINYTPDTAALFASETGYGRTTDELAGLLPDGYAHTTAHLDDLAVADARNVLLSGIDDGAGLTVFFGHSSTDQWTAKGLLHHLRRGGADQHRRFDSRRPVRVLEHLLLRPGSAEPRLGVGDLTGRRGGRVGRHDVDERSA